VPAKKRVLHVGAQDFELLRALEPSEAHAITTSKTEGKAPTNCKVHEVKDLHKHGLKEIEVDYIIIDMQADYEKDVQELFKSLKTFSHPRTRLIITDQNSIYQPIFKICQKNPKKTPNWLSSSDITNLLEIAGWEVITQSCEIICPTKIPGISLLLNRYLGRLPLVQNIGTTQFVHARPRVKALTKTKTSCSIILPARNEAGNIKPALQRIKKLGSSTELIIVEGNSTDDTWETIKREVKAYKGPLKVSYMRQPGKGKWDAVKKGFEAATGDILVIQDGDLTAPPEDLPKFFDAVCQGDAEFANGSRMVYPMESEAMRFLNLIGNKAFALSLSWILRQNIKDSLCGTKMMRRQDYLESQELVKERLGDFDPFGDFNLLFGSAMLGLKIRDIPVRYKDRTYGETNISRFSHGLILLKMTWVALHKIRFSKCQKEAQKQ
jgi:hypothetical protein